MFRRDSTPEGLRRHRHNLPETDRESPKGLSNDIDSIRSLIPIALGMLVLMAVIAALMKLVS
jgi:hypothetical protein